MIFKKLNESDEKTVSQIVPGVKFEDVEGARYEVIARDGMMATIKSEKEDDHNLFNGTNTINLKKMLDGGNLDNLFYKIHSTEMDYSNESKKRMKHERVKKTYEAHKIVRVVRPGFDRRFTRLCSHVPKAIQCACKRKGSAVGV